MSSVVFRFAAPASVLPIVQLGRPCRRVASDPGGRLEIAIILQEVGDAGTAEGVIADLVGKPGLFGHPLHQRQHVKPAHTFLGQRSVFGAPRTRTAEEGCFSDPQCRGRGIDVGFDVLSWYMVCWHLVLLASFFGQLGHVGRLSTCRFSSSKPPRGGSRE